MWCGQYHDNLYFQCPFLGTQIRLARPGSPSQLFKIHLGGEMNPLVQQASMPVIAVPQLAKLQATGDHYTTCSRGCMNHTLLGLPKQHAPGAAWFTCSLGFLNYIVGFQGCSACAEILVNCRGSEDKIQDKRHYYSVDSLLQKWKTLKCEWARIKIYTKHCHS